MKKVDIKTLAKENAFKLIGSDWMLVCAWNKNKFNLLATTLAEGCCRGMFSGCTNVAARNTTYCVSSAAL